MAKSTKKTRGKLSTKTARKANRVAIVTGGGTGLGRAMANRLASDGFEVAILGRRANRLKPKKGEKNLHAYVCDVGDHAQIKTTVKAVRTKFGRIDAVVNNAGVVQRATHDKITPEQIDHTFGINLIGMMHMCLACIPALKRTRGAIINISSSLTDRCAPEYGVYSATKGAMNAWSKTLAMELAQWGVRVNVVSPSLVRSEIYFADGMARKEYNDHLKVLGDTYFPLGRSGEPHDISGIVAFLASGEATWMTGQVVTIDGGEAVGHKRW